MPEPAIALDHGQGEDLRELIEHAETIAQWLHTADDILDDLAQTAYPAHFQPRSAVFWLIENLAHTRYRLTKPSSRRSAVRSGAGVTPRAGLPGSASRRGTRPTRLPLPLLS